MKLSVLLVIAAILATPWIWNAVKLLDCDFEADYKCEAIHGIGVVMPPASWITVWFKDDKDPADI